MRSAHIYARMSAEQHTELMTALHGPWRTATRVLIVVLSAAGWSATEIAELLLHYDPVTVRRWITRHQRSRKDTRHIVLRSQFGTLRLDSPHFKSCPCAADQDGKAATFSPMAALLPERTTPRTTAVGGQVRRAHLFARWYPDSPAG